MRLRFSTKAAICAAVVCLAPLVLHKPALAQGQPGSAKIGVHASLTGPGALAGKALLIAVQYAVDEASAAGVHPHFEVEAFDDHSTEEGARQVAKDIVASDVGIVLGPTASPLGLAACPIYAEASLPVIVSTIHADAITQCSSVFRTVVSTGEIGDTVANYIGRVLHGTQATVIYKDDGYGRPLAARFKAAANRLGINEAEHAFGTAHAGEEAARQALADPNQPPIILDMTYQDVVPILAALRRGEYRGAIFGTTTMARASFAELFSGYPEDRKDPGFFTDGVYAVSPVILDSANAQTLAFADRFRASTGQAPSWETAQGYDAAKLAMAALRAAARAQNASAKSASQRMAARDYLMSLDSPATAAGGVLGPLWFSPGRIRQQVVRVGRFHGGLLESASLQMVPVNEPDATELASGAVFSLEPGRFARIQRVAYTGVFINEVSRVDIPGTRFSADIYVWLRYAREGGPGGAEPSDLTFPTMVSGAGFSPNNPAEQAELPDGTLYRLWCIRGDFRNDFDLHRYPFDQQTLAMPFFNAKAAADRIVYVMDRRSMRASPIEPGAPPAAADAFRNLTQWEPIGTGEGRDNLVTYSSLGDLRRVGVESFRELSGFRSAVTIQRNVFATLVKNLLPLLLLTFIMFASLYFPHGLVKEKVTVAITAALSGAVLLTATNTQLGNVGYTIAVEYAFYVFFGLSVLCIISVLVAERLRVAKHPNSAITVERSTQAAFAVLVAGTVISAIALF